jgi:amidase
MTAPTFQSAVEIARRVRAREVGCLEVLDHYLDRVDRFNPGLNAIVELAAEPARERARAADAALSRGETWGPLHGVPMTVKEAFDVAGMVSTWGDPARAGRRATANAVVVDRLMAAGAVVFGKTNVPYMLMDWQTFNAIYGTTNNPWDLSRSPGGSSGGSAAVLAAGLAALEIGSDIGASIRNPAHFCGIYGHKPTFGILPTARHDVPGFPRPLDILVVGPMARSADDLAVALDVMAGPHGLDAKGWRLELPPPRRTRLADFRIAVMRDDPVCAVDRSVQDGIQRVADACARAGATVSDTARPEIDTVKAHANYIQLLRGASSPMLSDDWFAETQRAAATLDPGDESFHARAIRAAVQSHRAWFHADQERVRMALAWEAFFTEWDVLLCPAAASPAYPHNQDIERPFRTITVNGREENYNDQLFWAGISCNVYLPGTVAPAGLSPDGLPVGVQIVGPHLEDRTTIEFARLIADAVGGFVPPPAYTG